MLLLMQRRKQWYEFKYMGLVWCILSHINCFGFGRMLEMRPRVSFLMWWMSSMLWVAKRISTIHCATVRELDMQASLFLLTDLEVKSWQFHVELASVESVRQPATVFFFSVSLTNRYLTAQRKFLGLLSGHVTLPRSSTKCTTRIGSGLCWPASWFQRSRFVALPFRHLEWNTQMGKYFTIWCVSWKYQS